MTPPSLEQRLTESWPPEDWADLRVLVAVSGGADSVGLLRAMAAIREQASPSSAGGVWVAHFNHHLRSGADEDQRFVEALCRELQTSCKVGHADWDGRAGDQTLEEAARNARYQFLTETAETLGARFVVTAHTADDQAETILHRIVRGTGLPGLAGIPRVRRLSEAVTLIRPLLNVRRQDIVTWLEAAGHAWRLDPSNWDTGFTRNRIRHELLPLLAESYNSGVVDALLRLGRLAGEAEQVIEAFAEELAAGCVIEASGHRVEIDCRPLGKASPYVVRTLLIRLWRQVGWPLRSMDLGHWDRLAEMALAPEQNEPGAAPARIVLPGDILAERRESTLSLRVQRRPSSAIQARRASE